MRRVWVLLAAVALLAGCGRGSGGAGAAPVIMSMGPIDGPAGTVVTLSGAHLDGTRAVGFGGTPARFSEDSGAQVRAEVPAGARSGPITLSTAHGRTTTSVHFTVSGAPLPNAGRFLPAQLPSVSGVYPLEGQPGTIVHLDGENLTAVSAVEFGGVRAPFATEGKSLLRTVVPPRARSGELLVVTRHGATDAATFTVQR